MKYHYKTSGTCSRGIEIEINNGIISSVSFNGGCHGNTQGIASLVAGMTPQQVIDCLGGIQCGAKGTSCPDQLAKALQEIEARND